MNNKLVFLLAAPVLGLCGCVDVPVNQGAEERSQAVRLIGAELSPGGGRHETLHFVVKSYNAEKAEEYAKIAEKTYESIMSETGLYSFMPKEPYEIICYAGRAEYMAKTKQPEWSAGMTAGNAIVLYDSSRLQAVLAHEMTHLIFNEFMDEKGNSLRWLNEGLAVYMEDKASGTARSLSGLKITQIAFSNMTNFVPASEEQSSVGMWYTQVGSVVRYMIENGGRLGFSMFLSRLKDGYSMDDAIRYAYPGKWNGLDDIEKGWKTYINGL